MVLRQMEQPAIVHQTATRQQATRQQAIAQLVLAMEHALAYQEAQMVLSPMEQPAIVHQTVHQIQGECFIGLLERTYSPWI